MLSRRTDLPLERDALGKFLPWIVAFMVYLAIIASAAMVALHTVAGRWDKGISATLTVQIPSTESRDEGDARLGEVIAFLNAEPAITLAEPVAEQQVLEMLEPWLGSDLATGDLPIPRLVHVELATDRKLDVQGLRERLGKAVPGAMIDDHRVWLERLVRLIRMAQLLATVVLAFIASATVGTVVFTTRTGLAIHRDVIEVLHLIGAHDSYVANQFSGRALWLGLRGGAIGTALALPTLWGLGYLARRLEEGVLPEATLGVVQWVLALALPLAVAGISALTARITVMRTLARMV